jgi:hypothetical protein
MAEGATSCDLKVTPDKFKLGDTVELFFKGYGQADSAALENGYGLNIPWDILKFTPTSRGKFRLKAFIGGVYGSSECYADYIVE